MAFRVSAAAAWLGFSAAPARVGSGSSNWAMASTSRTTSTPSSIRPFTTPAPTPADRAIAGGLIAGPAAASSTLSRAGVKRAGWAPVSSTIRTGLGLGARAPRKAMASGWPGQSTE